MHRVNESVCTVVTSLHNLSILLSTVLWGTSSEWVGFKTVCFWGKSNFFFATHLYNTWLNLSGGAKFVDFMGDKQRVGWFQNCLLLGKVKRCYFALEYSQTKCSLLDWTFQQKVQTFVNSCTKLAWNSSVVLLSRKIAGIAITKVCRILLALL